MDRESAPISFVDLSPANPSRLKEAARVLSTAFADIGIHEWAHLGHAIEEVHECISGDNVCFACIADELLVAWAGMRPLYGNVTWELHPMVVDTDWQGRGIGRRLLEYLERNARARGALNIVLGADDETGKTTLARTDFQTTSIGTAIDHIANLGGHPYEFYLKCGYKIVGIIPDANGIGKPDILMWKRLG